MSVALLVDAEAEVDADSVCRQNPDVRTHPVTKPSPAQAFSSMTTNTERQA
jgi:hypothetical protein